MIDVVKQTPLEYSRQSRDYQVIARLYSALFNVSKMYADDMHIWDNDIDNKLTTLRARTVNFENDHTWDLDDLEAITSCFKYLVRRKGCVEAINACISILMKIKHITMNLEKSSVVIKNNNLTVYVEKDLLTVGIVEDLLKYLLPAGMTYRIIQYSTEATDNDIMTEIWHKGDEIIVTSEGYSSKMHIGNSKKKKKTQDKTIIETNSEGKLLQNTFVYDTKDGRSI